MLCLMAVSITLPDAVVAVLIAELIVVAISFIKFWGEMRTNKEMNALEHKNITTTLTEQAQRLTTIKDNHLPHIYDALARLEEITSAISTTVAKLERKSEL